MWSVYVSPQILFECKFEMKYLAGKIDINRQDYPALVSGGRFRVVCLRESSNPPSSPVSALVGSQPSARRPWGGPSRRDAPRFQISLMCLSCLSDKYKLVSTGEEGCPQVSKLASDKCRVFFSHWYPPEKVKIWKTLLR